MSGVARSATRSTPACACTRTQRVSLRSNDKRGRQPLTALGRGRAGRAHMEGHGTSAHAGREGACTRGLVAAPSFQRCCPHAAWRRRRRSSSAAYSGSRCCRRALTRAVSRSHRLPRAHARLRHCGWRQQHCCHLPAVLRHSPAARRLRALPRRARTFSCARLVGAPGGGGGGRGRAGGQVLAAGGGGGARRRRGVPPVRAHVGVCCCGAHPALPRAALRYDAQRDRRCLRVS